MRTSEGGKEGSSPSLSVSLALLASSATSPLRYLVVHQMDPKAVCCSNFHLWCHEKTE